MSTTVVSTSGINGPATDFTSVWPVILVDISGNAVNVLTSGNGVSSVNSIVNAVTIAGAGSVAVSNAGQTITVSGTKNGDVVGPAGATNTAIAVYQGATGKAIGNSAFLISSNILSTASNMLLNTGAGDIILGPTRNIQLTPGSGTVAINGNITTVNSGTDNIGSISSPYNDIYGGNFYASGQHVIPQRSVSFMMDNGPSALISGNQGFISIPYAATITGWNLIGNVSGSMVMDVYRQSYASWATESGLSASNSITAGTNPFISAAAKNQNTNVSWSGLAANDILEFYLSGTTTNITRASLTLTVVPV